MLREKLQGLTVPSSCLSNTPTVKLTAYVDDITVIIRSEDDVKHLIFGGTEQHMKKELGRSSRKMTGKLQRWKWIQAQLSDRGRV